MTCLLLGVVLGICLTYVSLAEVPILAASLSSSAADGSEHAAPVNSEQTAPSVPDPVLRQILLRVAKGSSGSVNETRILRAACAGISDLEGLQAYSELEYLDFSNSYNWLSTAVIEENYNKGTGVLPIFKSSGFRGMNAISDLNAIEELDSLRIVQLDGNLISDLQPLLKLQSLGRVSLNYNPLSDRAIKEQIPELRARGVIVEFEPRPLERTGTHLTGNVRPVPLAVEVINGATLSWYWLGSPEEDFFNGTGRTPLGYLPPDRRP